MESKTPRTDAIASEYEHLPLVANMRLWDLCRRLEAELAEARAEIGRLKADANKWRVEAKSKNDARLNLESAAESIKYWTKQSFQKDKLIEQMREALKGANKHFDRNYWNIKNDPDFEDLNKIWSDIIAALAAERGESI